MKDLRHIEKVERNNLRTLDAAENLDHQQKQKQQRQDFWFKKEYLKNAYNKEV